MHPEMSLVFLTVLAGLGQGALILLVILDALYMKGGGITPEFFYSAGFVSLFFPVVGMFAGFLHLGNPQRGWKAILMFKNSWLSREVVFLPAFVATDAVYLLLYYSGAPDSYRLAAGFVCVAAAMGLYVSSAMLYAAIRFIREWASAYTVVNFVVFGLASGAASVCAVWHFTGPRGGLGDGLLYLFAGLSALSLVLKALTYGHNAKIYQSVSVKDALGVNDPDVRLMDSGAAYRHFNTIEYFHPISAEKKAAGQYAVLAMAFLTPLILAILASLAGNPFKGGMLVLAAISSVGGLILERRLFFIEGNHLQNLYYGNYRVNAVKNPLLRKAG